MTEEERSAAAKAAREAAAFCEEALLAAERDAAEAEERRFYDNAQHDEWLKALEPIGTGPEKPHLQIAPWLIVIFAERYGQFDDGTRYKNYYVTESVGIAAGFLISALHTAGLACLTHTPNPMGFLLQPYLYCKKLHFLLGS